MILMVTKANPMSLRPDVRRPDAAFADADDLAKAYKRVFSQGDGKVVLIDLMGVFMYGDVSDGDHPWRFIGSQDVMRHIQAMMEDGDGPSTS